MSAEGIAHRLNLRQPTSTPPTSRAHDRRIPICVAEALEPRFKLAASVLTPALGPTTLPTAVLGGAKTNATATVDLTNISASTVSGATAVQLYFSTTPAFDANAVPITTFTKSGNLKPGGADFYCVVATSSDDSVTVEEIRTLRDELKPYLTDLPQSANPTGQLATILPH